jgi:hypothetical protein
MANSRVTLHCCDFLCAFYYFAKQGNENSHRVICLQYQSWRFRLIVTFRWPSRLPNSGPALAAAAVDSTVPVSIFLKTTQFAFSAISR